MKKILTISLFLICSFIVKGQYPIQQNLGGPTTLVKNPNYGGLQGGLIPYSFADTSAANTSLQYLKTYNGALIFTTDCGCLWFRYNNAWIQILPAGGGGGGGGTLAWVMPGNNPVVTDGSGYAKLGPIPANGLSFITSDIVRLSINTNGALGLGSSRDFGTSGYLLQSNGSGSAPSWVPAPSGTTPTWQETLVAGSVLNQSNTVTGSEPFTMSITSGGHNGTLVVDAGQVYLSSSLSGRISQMGVNLDTAYIKPSLGLLYIDTLNNSSSQNKLIGWVSSSGLVGNVTVSTGLSLSGGALSVTTGAPYWPLTGTATITGDNTINLSTHSLNIGSDVASGLSFQPSTSLSYFGDWNANGNGTLFTVDDGNQTVNIQTSKFNIADGSLGAASVGYVWKLQNTSTGEGAWAAASGGSPAGSNTQIQYNNSGAFGASANFTYDGARISLTRNTADDIMNVLLTSGHDAGITFKHSNPIYKMSIWMDDAAANLNFGNTLGSTPAFVLFRSSNNMTVGGTSDGGYRFDVQTGGARIIESAYLATGSGNVGIGGTTAGASAAASLGIFNGTAPTGSITNGIILYAEDVAASSELKVRDEAGNITVLSPHNFSKLPTGKPSEDLAWSYYSERNGKYISVDMAKAIRTIEELTQRVGTLEQKLQLKSKPPVKLIYKGKVKK